MPVCVRVSYNVNVCCFGSSLALPVVWCSVVQCGAVWCSVVQCGAVWCSVVQFVAVCRSVSQCVTIWCSVVQCVQCVEVCRSEF